MKKSSLELDKVVLLGRTLKEYAAYFDFRIDDLRNKKILDVGGGVSSFCAEAIKEGICAKSIDPIYEYPVDIIEKQCEEDIKNVVSQLPSVQHVYNWDFYKNIDELEQYRKKAYKGFLNDYLKSNDNYICGSLPKLDLTDNEFDIALVSYFLFLYSDRFDFNFHIESILELTRISKQEVRIYPLTTLGGKKSELIEKCLNELKCQNLEVEIRKVNFEFFKNANETMIIKKNKLNTQ